MERDVIYATLVFFGMNLELIYFNEVFRIEISFILFKGFIAS